MVGRHLLTVSLSVAVGALVFGTTGVAQNSAAGKSKAPTPSVNYKARQTRPIQLGTSGGNAGDSANGYCCSGTLGSLVQKNGVQYILSNTHVLAGDSTPGGNGSVSEAGDPVNQPGLIDAGCRDLGTDYVATVTAWAPLGSNANVDAAIAQVIPGAVNPSGAILGIGTISSTPAAAFVGQKVKKSGRTSGTTRSAISSLNATINVGYSNECAGGSFTAQFTRQIIISNKGSKFLAGGDSGSLMVEDVASNPRPIGLLYAGSSFTAIANPIQDVLNHFGVTMVGAAGAGSTGGTAQGGGSGTASNQGLARAIAAQERHRNEFMKVPGAVGHAIGLGNGNSPVIQVLVEEITPGARAAVRDQVDGVPVVLEEVGQIRAFPACSKKK
jgi:hypothetical protein